MKKLLLLFFTLFILFGCEGEPVLQKTSAVYVVDPKESSFYNETIKKFAEDSDFIRFIECSDEDYINELNNLSYSDYDIIISSQRAAELVLNSNVLRTKKVVCLSNELTTNYLNDNIAQFTYRVNNAGFILGLAAADYSSVTGKRNIGIIINENSELMNNLIAGFEDGVWNIFPEANIIISPYSEYKDIGRAVDQMVDNKVSVILTTTYNNDFSVIRGVINKRLQGENMLVLNYDFADKNLGNYTLVKNINDEEVEEVHNCILLNITNDVSSILDTLHSLYQEGNLNSGIHYSNGFEFNYKLNEDLNSATYEVISNRLNEYVDLLLNSQILVREIPSNPNIETRIKIVD